MSNLKAGDWIVLLDSEDRKPYQIEAIFDETVAIEARPIRYVRTNRLFLIDGPTVFQEQVRIALSRDFADYITDRKREFELQHAQLMSDYHQFLTAKRD